MRNKSTRPQRNPLAHLGEKRAEFDFPVIDDGFRETASSAMSRGFDAECDQSFLMRSPAEPLGHGGANASNTLIVRTGRHKNEVSHS